MPRRVFRHAPGLQFEKDRTVSTAAAEIIRTESVTKRFGPMVAVDKVSYLLRENEVAGIIGSNGAGKTTFFNLLTGYYPPEEGRIFYRGEDITRLTPQQRVARGLMRTFQLTAAFDNLSVVDNLVLSYFRAHEKPTLLHMLFNTCRAQRNKPKVVETLATFDLANKRNRLVTLSVLMISAAAVFTDRSFSHYNPGARRNTRRGYPSNRPGGRGGKPAPGFALSSRYP